MSLGLAEALLCLLCLADAPLCPRVSSGLGASLRAAGMPLGVSTGLFHFPVCCFSNPERTVWWFGGLALGMLAV